MYKFGKTSTRRLLTCDPRWTEIMTEVIKHIDCSVICGYRNEADQNYAFLTGNSKLKYPNSKHNSSPSIAIDVAPFPIIWEGNNARERFHFLAGMILMVAAAKGYVVRWGGDWDRDGDVMDNKFDDLVHFELVN